MSFALPAELKSLVVSFEKADDHIVITDDKGVIIYANHAAETHTGYSRSEMIGRRPGDLWGGLMPRDFYVSMWETISDLKQCFVADIQNKRKNGQRYWQEVHILPILSADGRPKFFVGIELSVADPSRVQDLLERYKAQRSVSPVQVRWPLEWLFSADNLTEKQLKDLAGQLPGDVLGTLTDDLILLSHVKFAAQEKPETFRIDALLEGLLSAVKKQFPNRQFHLMFSDNRSLRLTQHRSFLIHILSRMLQNAGHYSRPGAGRILLAVASSSSMCTVSCDDNGIGMAVSEQLKMFHKFFRSTKARRLNKSGAGLSMHVAKAIADVMDWQLTFTSAPGAGTSFKLTFPVKQGKK